MTDQELQALKDLFRSAGAIGSQGFEAMVSYTYASGLTWLIGGCVLLVLCLIGAAIAFAMSDKWDSDACAPLFLGSCMVGVVAIFMIFSNLTDVIEPKGSTVRELVKMAAK